MKTWKHRGLAALLTLACATPALAQGTSTAPRAKSAKTATPSSPSREYQSALEDMRRTLGIVPEFVRKFPQEALPGAWQEWKSIELSERTELTPRIKELIGLAVAARVQCRYCTYYHQEGAREQRIELREIQESVGMASLTGHWSTFLNGMQLDEAEFRRQTDEIIGLFRSRMERAEAGTEEPGGEQQAGTAPMATSKVETPEQAYRDIQATLGMIPDFLRMFPKSGIAGAWNEMKSLQMSADTALSGKEKELIGLAVAAQIPCHYCTYFHTQAAKLNGATETEVREALAMSGLVRHWSTYLNGMSIDEGRFRREVRQITSHLRAQRKAAPPRQMGGEVGAVDETQASGETGEAGETGDPDEAGEVGAAAKRGSAATDSSTRPPGHACPDCPHH